MHKNTPINMINMMVMVRHTYKVDEVFKGFLIDDDTVDTVSVSW